jgi:hypothetical protein
VSTRAGGALLLVLVLVLSACTLDLEVAVDVRSDGSGAVDVEATVDAGALQRVGGDLGEVLDLDGLRAEGWTVDGPTATDDGGATVRLRQGFADPEEATEVLAELAGPEADGPFRDLRVEVDRSAFRTRWRFGGAVDLERGLALPGVAPQADGEPLPEDLDQLEERLGDSLDRLLRLRIGVRLPGDVRSNATTKADNGAVWQVRFGDGSLDLEATGTRTHPLPYVLIGLGGLALLVGLVVLLVRLAGRVTAADAGGPARR